MSYPTLDEFMALPIEEIAKVAPASLYYTPGGTRRAAAMMGIDPRPMQYAEWCHSETAQLLRNNTTAQSNKTLYWAISQTPTDLIDMALRKACLHGVSNQKEAIYAVTGDNVEPITMLLSFGKPMGEEPP